MSEVIYIPLGTRCSSCSIIDGQFGLRKFALPFDWIDIPIEAMQKFFVLEDIDAFCDSYFNLDNIAHQRSKMDNAWFPHHLHDGNNVEREVLELKQKFNRRLKRLYEVLHSATELIFLTTWGHVQQGDSEYYKLIDTISGFIGRYALFISVNLYDRDYVLGKHVNLNVPLQQTWNQYDTDVAQKLRGHELTKPYFK